jgi:hypothetical protein
MSNYYLWLDERKAGPFKIEAVRKMLERGTVDEDTLYWREGDADEWRPLRDCALGFVERPAAKTALIVEEKTLEPTAVEERLEMEEVDDGKEYARAIPVANNLETAGAVFLGLGVFVGVAGLLAALANDTAAWFLFGLGAVAWGFFVRLLLSAGAAVIRLQCRRLRFTAKAVQFSAKRSCRCSLCKAPARRGQARCSSCGAEFKP